MQMLLNETLEDATPADALRRLAALRTTGAIRFGGEAGCTVYLHQGNLYFARDEHTDEALATALVRPGRLTPENWADAVTAAGDAPTVGELLVRRGAIDQDLLASVMLSVVYDPLIRLFRAPPAEHTYEPDTVHWLGPYRAFPVEAIINEVEHRAKEVDDWEWLIPTLDVYVTANLSLPGNAPQVTLLREDWELVTALATAHSIPQLSARLGRGQYSTARVVHRLATAGLVEVNPDAHVPLPARAKHEPSPAPTPAFNHTDAEMDAAFGQPDYDALAVWAGGGDAPSQGAQPGEAPTAAAAEEELDPNRDPNAVWLENLYAKYIDTTEETTGGKRKKGEPNPVQVAFAVAEQSQAEKVSTLKRLMTALKRV